jgi:aspartate aminotransferase
LATINPGDEVLIPVPYWVSYPEMVSLCGGVPVLVQTKKEAGFKVTLEDITPHLSDRTKMIILTNPSNPTGNVFSKKELQSLCGALVEKNILILADEIYERVIYDEPFTSIASLSEEIYDKTILINGLSKSASMTGWRLGYSATNKKLAKAMGSIQSHLTSHPSTITQAAAIVALRACDDEINHMIHTYKERRDYIENFFKQWGKLDIIPPKGAFYVFIDISPLRAKLKDESLSLKVCEDMIEKYKVAFIPGIGFGQDDFIRLSYAAAMEDIKEGLVRFKTYVDQVLED